MNIRQISPILIVGDIAAFLLFAVVGLSSHEKDYSPASFARTVLPFLLPWLAVAFASGLFRPTRGVDPSSVLKPVALAWLPAWAVGLALRSLLWGRPFVPAFAIVTLVLNLVLLLCWRATHVALQDDGSSEKTAP